MHHRFAHRVPTSPRALSLLIIGTLFVSLLTACGSSNRRPDPEPGDIDVPIPFNGCMAVEPGYLPDLDEKALIVTHHALEVGIEPGSNKLAARDVMTVEALSPSDELLLYFPIDFVVSTGEGRTSENVGFPIVCGTGSTATGDFLRITLPQALPMGEKAQIELRYRVERNEIALETPLTSPFAVELAAQIDPQSVFFGQTLWHPIPVLPHPATASIEVVVPEDYRPASSGQLVETIPDLAGWMRWRFTVPNPVNTAQGYALVVVPLREPQEETLESKTTVSVLHAGDSPADGEATLERAVEMVSYLESTLGAWPLGRLTVAEVSVLKDRGEASAMGLGVVHFSAAVRRDPQAGYSFVFDMLARQWLSMVHPLDPRLVEGTIQFMAADFGEDGSGRLGELKDTWLQSHKAGVDVAISDLTLMDEAFLPVAYGKVPLVWVGLRDTIGVDAFNAGWQQALISGPDASGIITLDALQASMEQASGKSLTGYFDTFFRSTATPWIEVDCSGGVVEARVSKDTPLPMTATVAMGEEGTLVSIPFADKRTVTTETTCEKTTFFELYTTPLKQR